METKERKQTASLLSIAQRVVNELGNCVFDGQDFYWCKAGNWKNITIDVNNAIAAASHGRDVDKIAKMVRNKYALPQSMNPYFEWRTYNDSWIGSGWEPFVVKQEEVVFTDGVLNLITNERRNCAEIWGPVINLSMADLPDLTDGKPHPTKFTELIKSINQGLPNEEWRICFQDVFSFLLRPHTHFRHAIYMVGPAGCRKSTIASALVLAPAGARGVSRVSERRLGYDERFASNQLVGKFANLCDDMCGDIRYRDWLKSYTGNGVFQAEYKFVNPQNYPATAKLISTCNLMPTLDDSTDAVTSRVLLFEFTKVGTDADPTLVSNSPHLSDAYWSDKDVRLHIVAWLLEGARRVVVAGNTFKKPQAMIDAMVEHMVDSDPVKAWMNSHLQATGRTVDFIPTSDLLLMLNDAGCHCNARELANYMYQMKAKSERRKIDGVDVRGYSCITLRAPDKATTSGASQLEDVPEVK